MSNKRRAHKILWIECTGFALIIVVSWLNELFRLAQRLLGGVAQPNWRESALESIVVLIIWSVVVIATRGVLRRFYYLEEQLRMCAWCQRLESGGENTSLEDYLRHEMRLTGPNHLCIRCGRQLLPRELPGADPPT